MISPENLQSRLLNNQVIPLSLATNKLLVDESGVLVWPALDMIVFSDLHLEKGSFLSQFANPLPRFDSAETLNRMRNIIDIYDCKHVVCLGDSLHDGNAISRMQNSDLKTLNDMVCERSRFTWVLGNHDPDIPDAILGERVEFLHVKNILLVHEPENLHEISLAPKPQAQIIGHFHPKSRHKISTRKVSGKCFLKTDDILLMPAFGKYTGGLDSKDKAYDPMLKGKSVDTFLMYNQKLFLL